MPGYRTNMVLQSADNVAANYATNSWYCAAGDVTELAAFNTAVRGFYAAIQTVFGGMMKATDQISWKSYDLNDPEPRAPKLEASSSISPDNTTTLPAEVSLCLSFQGLKVSGQSQARRRGRVYLPFFKASNNDGASRPSAGLVNLIVASADALVTASKASSTWKWVVYSPTTGSFIPVDNGWVDNEWDTQRRRGRAATTRTLFS